MSHRYGESHSSRAKPGLPHAGAKAVPPRCPVPKRGRGCVGRNSSKAPDYGCSSSAITFSSLSLSLLHHMIQQSVSPIECLENLINLMRKSFSTSSIKFTGFPERRRSLNSSRVYDCKQTLIILRNCPIALF